MTHDEILRIARMQSAIDISCSPDDFLRNEPVIVHSRPNDRARRYLTLPFSCQLVSYGSNIVASVHPELESDIRGYITRFPAYRCFETPNLHVLGDILAPHGLQTCFMAEYFLPRPELIPQISAPYETRILIQEDFAPLYLPEWSNALCRDRAHLDVLGVGAYDHGRLIALAGCSADCDDMWQIGIDVLPAYRGQGIAAALVSRLAHEILERGKVPFYCAAWSNIRSVRTAIASGFRPAWVELTAKPQDFVRKMNQDA